MAKSNKSKPAMVSTPVARRGALTLPDQIEQLKQEVGPQGVKQAERLVAETEHGIIKLAFKLLPRQQSPMNLGSRIEGLLAMIDNPKEREQMRTKLLQAKQTAKA